MDWRTHSFKYNLYLRTSSLDSRFRYLICLLKPVPECLMGFSNVSKTELAFPPQKSVLSSIFPLQVSLAKKYSFFDTSPSLLSHPQSVSKSCCFFLQNIFKNWPLLPSTLVQVTFISPGLLPSNWFPCFHPCSLSVYFQYGSYVKNLCHCSIQNSTLTPQLAHCKNQSPYNGPTLAHLPTSFPTALFLACSRVQPCWPHNCSSNMPDMLSSRSLTDLIKLAS